MPHYSVHIFEEALDGEVERQIIAELTEAVVRVFGERARELAVVEIVGVPSARCGLGGMPGDERAMPLVTLGMREPALNMPEVPDAPAQLIASITDAMVAALGERVRPHVNVTIAGVPTGRSGVGGVPV